ncbi:MAG TPA: 50S ribosomal protein L25 [Thermoleophilaceae bacterium]|nr:50S ribosomal protein L25 [Thermoleophilaceae bacterium]
MAAPTRPQLKVEDRTERGSRATRRLRRQGLVPGVVYGGKDGKCSTFSVDARELRRVLIAGSAVFDVEVEGTVRPVIVKDQHRHPVRDHFLHIDLLEVRLDEKIQTTVALELTGVEEAPGVKEGGVLEHVTRELNIVALPGNIPEGITVDVSHLEVAGTMHLSEVAAPEGVEFLDDLEETIVATITTPTEVEEPEIEEEAELVGEEGEAAEGATGEEAEAAADGEGGEGAAEDSGGDES